MIDRQPPEGGPGEIAVGVLTVDQHLRIRTWSPWLERASGISAADACGRALQAIVPDLETRGLLARFTRVLESGEAQVLAPAFHQYLIACAPLSPSPHFSFMQQLVTLGPLREHDRVVGVMATIEDVTARLDAERTLAAELQSPDPAVRQRAAARAGLTASAGGSPANVSSLLRIGSWQERRHAVRGIARHASSELVGSLIDALREEHRDFNVLSSALQLLGMIEIDVTGPLADLLRTGDADLRIQAAHALGDQASPAAIPPLLAALDDPDENVRFHAIESLGRLQCSDAVERLAAIAESRDFFLAFPAVEALARVDDPRVAPRLAPLLDDDALCVPVAEALGRLGNGDMTRALAGVLNRPHQPVGPVAVAIAHLHDVYERRYGGGAYIVSEFQAALSDSGARRLVDALERADRDELRALVVLLGWVESSEVGPALARLLGRDDVSGDVVEALVRHGRGVFEFVVEQLDGEDSAARLAAVLALGRLGDRRATGPLLDLIDDERAIAVAAAGALGALGDPAAFEPLLARLGHPDATVRQAITAALNSLGHPEMEGRVAALLHSPDPCTREAAVRIAGYFGYASSADAVFERCLDEHESVRRAALEHAPYVSESRALPLLLHALAHDTPRVRATAANALGQIAGPESQAGLIRALADEDSWVRYFAARGLGDHRDHGALGELGEVAARDDAPHVRIAALEAIGSIDGPSAADLLLPHAEHPDPGIAAAALTSLGVVSDGRAADALERALRSLSPELRLGAIAALTRRGDGDAARALQWAAESDASVEVARSAIGGLAHLAAAPGAAALAAIEALVGLTAESSRREAAIEALSRLPADRIDRVAHGLSHPLANVRRWTVEALTRMKHPDASQRLRGALDHEDARVREAAVIALDRVGARGVEPKLSALAAADPAVAVRRAAEVALSKYRTRHGDRGAGD